MSGLVSKNDARRIGNAVRKIEAATLTTKGAKNRPIWAQAGIPAKITQTFVAGQYACEEVQILSTPGFNIFEQKNDPRIWDGQAGNLPLVFEVNKITFLEPGTIVFLQKASAEGESVNQWYFDSGGGPPKAFHHCDVESSLASIHLLNDVQVAAPDRELGPALYGELPIAQVDPSTGVNIQGEVKWRPIFGVAIDVQGGTSGTLQDGYLAPQFGLGSAGTVFFGDFNNRHLRMKNMGAGTGLRQLNIFHDVLPDSEIDDANEMFPGHSSTSGAYVLNQVGVDALVGGSTVTGAVLQGLVNLQSLDILGHVKRQNGVNNSGPYVPPTIQPQNDFLLEVAYTGTYPTSGTLYDVAIGQETRITDGAGADVVGEDGVGVNRLQWNITTGAVSVPASLSGGIPQNPSFKGDSTNYTGPKFGSNTDIDHDLSRIFNCEFTLNGTDKQENTNDSSATLTTDFITLEKPIFVTIPETDMDFDVTFSLVEGGIPIPYTRFDNTGRYEIDAFLFLKSDGLAPDANGDLIPAVPITNGNLQGVIVGGAVSSTIKFNITIPATSVDDKLCCIYYVDHIDAAARPNSFGYIFDGSTGDSLNNQEHSAIVGAGVYECDAIPTPLLITDTDFTEVLQGTQPMADLGTSVQLEIFITKGLAPTTDFSNDGKSFTIFLENQLGTEFLKHSQIEGPSPTEPDIEFASPVIAGGVFVGTAQETDGFTYQLEAFEIETGITAIPQGEYTFVITIEGCPDVLRKTFIVDGSISTICWSDDFEDALVNLTRWLENLSGGVISLFEGVLVQSAITSTTDTAFLESNMPDIVVSSTTTWFFSNDFINIGIPSTSNPIEQNLFVNTSGNNFTIGYKRSTGTEQQFFIAENGVDVRIEDNNNSSANVSIERGPYIMSDDFTGVGENSDDVDADTANRWDQRWQFVQYDVDVFKYDLVEQTPRTVNVYDSQAGTPDDLVEVYDSQAGTPDDTQFKYGAINLRRNLFGAIVTTSTRAAGAVLTLTDFSSSGSGTETTGVDVVETEILNQVSVLTMGIRMITTNTDTSGRLKFGSPSGIEYSSTNDFTSFDGITTSSIYLGILCFDETWSSGDDTNVVEFVYPQTLPIIELSVGVVNSDSSSNFTFKWQLIRTTQGATTVMHESDEIETGTTGWTSTGAGGFEKDIVTDITADVLAALPIVYQT